MFIVKLFLVSVISTVAAIHSLSEIYSDSQRGSLGKCVTSNCSVELWEGHCMQQLTDHLQMLILLSSCRRVTLQNHFVVGKELSTLRRIPHF